MYHKLLVIYVDCSALRGPHTPVTYSPGRSLARLCSYHFSAMHGIYIYSPKQTDKNRVQNGAKIKTGMFYIAQSCCVCVFFFLFAYLLCLLCAMAVVTFGGKLLENPIRTKLFIEGLSRQDDGCLMLGYFVSSSSFFIQIFFYLCRFRWRCW